jgi:hypothetical protein
MKRKPQNEYNVFHLFLGLLMGFMLGGSMIYWHTNRQTDRILNETFDKVLALFSTHTIHLEAGDSIILIRENNTQEKPLVQQTPDISSSANRNTQYRIAQDKLLYTKIITLPNTVPIDSTSNRLLDSLMGNTSKPSPNQLFFIEFWESPLNSIGYKMGKNKIILYGIKSFDLASLAKYEGKTYLRYLNEYYPLEITSTFKPLVPVNESFFSQDIQPF